jgi:hypothetical protein
MVISLVKNESENTTLNRLVAKGKKSWEFVLIILFRITPTFFSMYSLSGFLALAK